MSSDPCFPHLLALTLKLLSLSFITHDMNIQLHDRPADSEALLVLEVKELIFVFNTVPKA